MPHTTSTGLRLYFETSGDPSGEPLLLISGLTAQLIVWRDEFVQLLVDRGLFVIRMDNREVGFSGRTAGAGTLTADYTIDAFADDAFRVLDELGLESAHLAGESMGGAIVQRAAILRPERVRSATLFYTAPGFDLAYVGDAILEALAAPPLEADMPREEAIAAMAEGERMAASTAFPFDEEWMYRSKAIYYDRGFDPAGMQRQASAMQQSGKWLDELPSIRCPTAVIHGRADRLVKTEAAFDLGRHIPDAELHLYPGMGHQVVRELWAEFVPIMLRTIGRAAR